MKNVTKKLLSLGLCAAMVAGMTACGNEGNTPAPSSDTPDTVQSSDNSGSTKTVTVPCFNPVSDIRRPARQAFVSSGRAEIGRAHV